ncbi:MAG: hypothetical protein KA784_00205 [Aquabacterium sp.]|nr:hypothetical protein [Aquabacterium sp.]
MDTQGSTVLKWMLDAEELRMVYLVDVENDGTSFDRVFKLGRVDGPWPKWSGPERKGAFDPSEKLTNVAALLRELDDPGTVPELADRTGINARTVNDLVVLLRTHELARVADWDQSNPAPVAMWGNGPGADARRPSKIERAASRKKTNAKYWAGRRERILQQRMLMALGGAANQPMAQAA